MSTLVNQVKINFERQINSAQEKLDDINRKLSSANTDITNANNRIKDINTEIGILQEQYNSASAEYNRLSDLRHKPKKSGGCNQTIGWDNGCLNDFNKKQAAQQNIMNVASGKINALKVEKSGIETDVLPKKTSERNSLNTQKSSQERVLKDLNLDFDKAVANAIQMENASAISQAEAANMGTRIQHQAEIERQRVEGDIKKEEQKTNKNTTYAIIGGAVFVVLAIAGLMAVALIKR